MTQGDERTAILAALDKWIRQRPGLDFANYGDVTAYRSEMRSITKDGREAKILLRDVRNRPSITAEHLKDALKHSYSGRLSWNGKELDYCTGQYWPTEYRRAACAVLASVLWNYIRCDLPKGDERPGDTLRAHFRREYGRGIAGRWFS